ncbi:hypothetical protein CMR97_19255 [Salmonella enterica]|nr:hypothetical protein [Salmonella enterica]
MSQTSKSYAVLALTLAIGCAFIGGVIALTERYGDQLGNFMVSAPAVVDAIVLVVLGLGGAAAGLTALSLACRVFYGRWWG